MTQQKPQAIKDVSLIVPCNHPQEDLIALLRAVLKGAYVPQEILIVRSGAGVTTQREIHFEPLSLEPKLDELLTSAEVSLEVCNIDSALPGDARNIGLAHARGSVIAFLDIKTIPEETWLKRACETLSDPRVDGVWGSRVYESSTFFGGIIRDGIYGRAPVRGVAGSVFRKEVSTVVGKMIAWAPAGEDGDWIRRVETHRLFFVAPNGANNRYQGLDSKSLLFFMQKWWRYYHYARLLSVNDRDRWLAYGLIYGLLIFFAFNWNYKISEAVLGSPLVVPHLTKFTAIAGPAIYILFRSIYLPIRRGVPMLQIFPIRFLMILLVAAVLDFVKTLALLVPSRKIRRFDPTDSTYVRLGDTQT